MSLLILSGSPARTSRTDAVLTLLGQQLRGHGQEVTGLNLRDLPAAALLGRERSPAVDAAIEAVAGAEALVVGTPVQTAAYSGLLKTFFDLLPPRALKGKTVLPVAVGGTLAHFLMIDHALRPVLQALSAGFVLPGIFATGHQVQIGEAHREVSPDLLLRLAEASARLAGSVGRLDPVRPEPVLAYFALQQGL